MQHRVGIAIPVVATVPARRRHQPQPLATVGEAPGHLPANALLVGEHQIERGGANLPGRLEGLVHRLRAGQVEEGVQRAIGFQLRGLQCQAVATTELQRLQRVLALAEYAVEQRAVTGLENGLADRPLALDEVGLVALAGRQPFAVGQVHQPRAFATHLLEIEVLVVAHDHGHAPAELAVEARHYGGDAGDGDTRRLELRCADLHEIPVRGHRQRQVRVVGQDRLAAARVAAGDGPVVGGRHAGRRQSRQRLCCTFECRQPGHIATQLQALELVHLVERQHLVRVDGQQPGQLVATDFLRHQQRGDLFLQVLRKAEIEQTEHQHRILGLPVLRFVAGLGEVHRQFVAMTIQVGVHATGVHLEELFHPRRGFTVQQLGALAQIDRPHETVGFQHARADHFRQAALGHQPKADHLAQSVGGVDVSHGKQRIVKRRGFDQRHAHGIAPDARTARQSGQRLNALCRRQTGAVAVIEIGLTTAEAGQAERGPQRQANQGVRQTQRHRRLLCGLGEDGANRLEGVRRRRSVRPRRAILAEPRRAANGPSGAPLPCAAVPAR